MRPDSAIRAARRLSLGIALSVCSAGLLAQSPPPQAPPAAPKAPIVRIDAADDPAPEPPQDPVIAADRAAAAGQAPAAGDQPKANAPGAKGKPHKAEPPAVKGEPPEADAGAASGDPPKADATAAAGEPPKAEGSSLDVNLSGVNVQGKRNAFTDSDKRLKQLQDSLPCNGCDATPHVKKKLVARVLNAIGERVLPTEAPDHSNREANDKAQDYLNQGVCTTANMNGCFQSNQNP